MTTYRFRVKSDYVPTTLWRDKVVGVDCTFGEFQVGLNRAVGLNQDRLWFFGTNQDYWDSDIQYKCPEEIAQPPGGLMQEAQVFASTDERYVYIRDYR